MELRRWRRRRVSPAEGDCWDKVEGPEGTGLKGSDIGPNAEETWYDGFDQDCKGDDDYDADGDEFVPDDYVGLGTTGVDGSGFLPGGDCWDDVLSPAEGMLGGAEIYPGAPDAWYDGLDNDCGGEDDFDQDGDGFAALLFASDYLHPLFGRGRGAADHRLRRCRTRQRVSVTVSP